MKKAVSAAFVAFLILALAMPALAQRSIREQIHSQQVRIDHGIRNGELSPREARMLRDNLDSIRAQYRRARAEGTLRIERRRIERRLAENSRMIRRHTHNRMRRVY